MISSTTISECKKILFNLGSKEIKLLKGTTGRLKNRTEEHKNNYEAEKNLNELDKNDATNEINKYNDKDMKELNDQERE